LEKYSSSVNEAITQCLSLGRETLQEPIQTIIYRTVGTFIRLHDHWYFWSRTPRET